MVETEQPIIDTLDALERKAAEENIPIDGYRIHPSAAELCLRNNPHKAQLRKFKGLPVTVDARTPKREVRPVWDGGVPTSYAAGDVELPTRIDGGNDHA